MTVKPWKALALTFSSAYTSGLLLTSVVLVGSWRQMEPPAVVDWFSNYAAMLGGVQAPIEVLAIVFIGVAAFERRDVRTESTLLFLAGALLVGTLLLLPVYFVGANTALIEKTIPLSEVAAEIDRWRAWNWFRTTLSLGATILILIAMGRGPHRVPGGESCV